MLEKQSEFNIPVEPLINQAKSIWHQMIIDPISFVLIPMVKIVLIIFLTVLATRLLDRLMDWLFQQSRIKGSQAFTLHKLLKSISRYMIYFICMVTILINIGFDPMPVFASAGILGLAIGIGAQNLVRDIISGLFLIFEGQLEVGDVVQINNEITGTVEEVGLRIIKIREYNQRLHYLPNGEITQVTNYNRQKMRAIVTVTVPYELNVNRIEKILSEVCDDIYAKYTSQLLEKPEVTGITNIDQSGVHVTVTALCLPGEYIKLERQIRIKVILAFQRNGVEINYPSQLILQTAQSLHNV